MSFLNTKTVERVKSGFDLLPKGMYRCMVTKLEEKTSQAGGAYISAQFDVIEGDFKGRKVFHNFTTKNANPTAVAIGKSDLAKFIEACGYEGEVRDEKHFYSICMDQVLWLDVGTRKDKQTGEDRQQVKDFVTDKTRSAEPAADDVPPPTDDSIPF
jgi:hypothetical protein